MPSKRYVNGLAALLVVALCLTLDSAIATAHTGQGNAVPANDGWHPWPTDGCSTPFIRISSVPGVYDFRHACVHHGGCYKGFPRNGRPTYWTSRLQCDTWFYNDMIASCRWRHGPRINWPAGPACRSGARLYHGAVRRLGAFAYKGPWRN